MSRSKNTDKRRFAGKWVLPDGSECKKWSDPSVTMEQIMFSRWVYDNEVPHKQRACGFEYWSRRPCSQWSPGKKTKIITHRIERARAKAEVKRESLEL